MSKSVRPIPTTMDDLRDKNDALRTEITAANLKIKHLETDNAKMRSALMMFNAYLYELNRIKGDTVPQEVTALLGQAIELMGCALGGAK